MSMRRFISGRWDNGKREAVKDHVCTGLLLAETPIRQILVIRAEMLGFFRCLNRNVWNESAESFDTVPVVA